MSTSTHIDLSSQSRSDISSSWIFDSSVSKRMSSNSKFFNAFRLNPSLSVMTVDVTPLPLAGVDCVNTPNLSLSDVYCVPTLTLNLIFISQLYDSRYLVQFSSIDCHMQGPQSQKLIEIDRR